MRFGILYVAELTVFFALFSACADLVPTTQEVEVDQPTGPSASQLSQHQPESSSTDQLALMNDLFSEPELVQPVEQDVVVSWEGLAPSFVLVTSLLGEPLAFETDFRDREFRLPVSKNVAVTVANFEPDSHTFSSVVTLLEVAPGQTIAWNDHVEPKTVHFQVETTDLPIGTRLRSVQSNCPALEFGALELSRYVAAEDCIRRSSASSEQGARIVAIAGDGQDGRQFFSDASWRFGDAGFEFSDWRDDWVSEVLLLDHLQRGTFIQAELRQCVPEDTLSDQSTTWWSAFNSEHRTLGEQDDTVLFERLLPLDSVLGARLVVRDGERGERGQISLLASGDHGLTIDFDDLLSADGTLTLARHEDSWRLSVDGEIDSRTDCVAGRVTLQSPNVIWRFFGPPSNDEYRLPELPAPFNALSQGQAVGDQELTLVNVTQVESCVDLLLELAHFPADMDPTHWRLPGRAVRWASIISDD